MVKFIKNAIPNQKIKLIFVDFMIQKLYNNRVFNGFNDPLNQEIFLSV